MTDTADLERRLRNVQEYGVFPARNMKVCTEAADALAAQRADIAALRSDIINLSLRLCMIPTDELISETRAILNKWRPNWEAAAEGMPIEEAAALGARK